MSGLSRGLASLSRRAGLVSPATRRAERDRRRQLGWRWPLDNSLLRRLERLALSPRRPVAGGLGGEHRSRAQAMSTDFVDYRPYLPGDDLRQLDWNAYGRLDELFVKLTEARERLPLYLLLDCSASMGTGEPNKLDLARQLAAALGFVALARNDTLELVRLGGRGPAARSLRGKQRFREHLAALGALEAAGQLGLDVEIEGSWRSNPVGQALRQRSGQAVLISDLLQPDGYQKTLEALGGAGLQLSVVQLLSPQELEPAPGGDYELQDVESGEKVQVGMSPQAVETYQTRLADWCASVERYCSRRGLPYVLVRTDQPLEWVVLVRLRQAGILC